MKINRFFGVLLCFLPGAAHLYLGLKKQGIQLMAMFFIPIVLTDIIRLSIFMFILPIIWFYSFFDGLRKVNGQEELVDSDVLFLNWIDIKKKWSGDQNKILGYGLIVLGGLMIFDRILMPVVGTYLGRHIREYLQMGFVSLLLILGGVKLIIGTKLAEGTDK